MLAMMMMIPYKQLSGCERGGCKVTRRNTDSIARNKVHPHHRHHEHHMIIIIMNILISLATALRGNQVETTTSSSQLSVATISR